MLQYLLNGTDLPLKLEERSRPVCDPLGPTSLLVTVALANAPSRNIAAREGWTGTVCLIAFALVVSR